MKIFLILIALMFVSCGDSCKEENMEKCMRGCVTEPEFKILKDQGLCHSTCEQIVYQKCAK